MSLREKCPYSELKYGPYFSAFGLNTGRYGVSLHIQSECGNIRTRINPNANTFNAVYIIFKHFYRKTKSPFTIYADFESIVVPKDNGKQNPNES